jgi:hypothetical protein
VERSFTVSGGLSLALGVTSSPAGPITTGSVITASLTVANRIATSQTVTLTVRLAYTGSGSRVSVSGTVTLRRHAGQTLTQRVSFKIAAAFPRGTDTLSALGCTQEM